MDIIEAVEPTEIKQTSDSLPLLPLENVVILPQSIIPIIVVGTFQLKQLNLLLSIIVHSSLPLRRIPRRKNLPLMISFR